MATRGERVRVVVRVRPFLAGEKEAQERRCLWVEQEAGGGARVRLNETLTNSMGVSSTLQSVFEFDAAYEEDATQQQLFEREVRPALQRVVAGQTATVFCFGMTGTGKTHTMQGKAGDPGIVPRALQALFALCAAPRVSGSTLSASFLEIYKEKAFDLLETPGPQRPELPLRESAEGAVTVAGLSEHALAGMDEFERLYARAVRNRKTSATQLNGVSSRSHSVLTVRVCVPDGRGATRSGKLQLIDLAGNEDNRVSGNAGQRMAESATINQSLFTLGKVLHAIAEGQPRVPFRDSKLTRLLQDSLGGREFAVMVCNVAPGERFLLFTLRTLEFGALGRKVVNYPTEAELVAAAQSQSHAHADGNLRQRLAEWRNARKPAGISGAAVRVPVAAASSTTQPQQQHHPPPQPQPPTHSQTHPPKPAPAAVPRGAVGAVASLRAAHASAVQVAPQPAAAPLVDLSLLNPLLRQGAAVAGGDPAIIAKLEAVAQEVSRMSAMLQATQQQQQQVQQQMLQMRQQQQQQQPPPSTASEGDSAAPKPKPKKAKKRSSAALAAPAEESPAASAPQPSTLCEPAVAAAGARKLATLLTPISAGLLAKEHLRRGRALEADGRAVEALAAFSAAAALAPEDDELQAKVQTLTARVQRAAEPVPVVAAKRKLYSPPLQPPLPDAEKEGGEGAAPAKRTKPSPPRAPLTRVDNRLGDATQLDSLKREVDRSIHGVLEAQLLDVLNKGDVAALQRLHTIGRKRAEAIVEARQRRLFATLSDLSSIGLSEAQVAQFTKKNLAEIVADAPSE
jgi:hypothetical protein